MVLVLKYGLSSFC
uniref:Pyruvate dehydrogenase E1 component subunit beta-1 isoform X2 n=1 Tax=Rhizophora mucronata TaxID=61149 RepID=A0A2P2M2V6_RHIMU